MELGYNSLTFSADDEKFYCYIVISNTSKVFFPLFEDLTKRKEDDQQRNWMLHKDEHIIRDLLQNLQNVLQNAQKEVCLYVLKKYKYFYVLSLIEYFQVNVKQKFNNNLLHIYCDCLFAMLIKYTTKTHKNVSLKY